MKPARVLITAVAEAEAEAVTEAEGLAVEAVAEVVVAADADSNHALKRYSKLWERPWPQRYVGVNVSEARQIDLRGGPCARLFAGSAFAFVQLSRTLRALQARIRLKYRKVGAAQMVAPSSYHVNSILYPAIMRTRDRTFCTPKTRSCRQPR